MPARHVRGESHRQGKRLDEHSKDLDRPQYDVNGPCKTMRHHVLEMSNDAMSPGTRGDDGAERDHGKSGRDVVVGRRRRAAMEYLAEERLVPKMENVVVQDGQHLEYRDHTDQIC